MARCNVLSTQLKHSRFRSCFFQADDSSPAGFLFGGLYSEFRCIDAAIGVVYTVAPAPTNRPGEALPEPSSITGTIANRRPWWIFRINKKTSEKQLPLHKLDVWTWRERSYIHHYTYSDCFTLQATCCRSRFQRKNITKHTTGENNNERLYSRFLAENQETNKHQNKENK